MNLLEFLSAFFPTVIEPIYFRAFKAKDAPDTDFNRAQMSSYTRRELAAGGEFELRKLNHLRGVYFAPNSGGHTDGRISRFNAVFVESDTVSIEDQHAALDASPVAMSIRVQTKRSVHAYWLLDGNCTDEEWRDLQERLIKFFDGDKAIKNPSRVMRLPTFMHLRYDPDVAGNHAATPVEVVQFNPERRYTIGELAKVFPPLPKSAVMNSHTVTEGEIIGNGNRNSALSSIAGRLRRDGLEEPEIFSELAKVNHERVRPLLPEAEVRAIAHSIQRYSPAEKNTRTENGAVVETPGFDTMSFPTLPREALYGLAGDVIRTLEPHTESDNAAILVQLLAGFGCLINKSAYFKAEADFHHTRLFAVIVGASSKGRKGTSFGHVKRLLCRVDESFRTCIQDGLSSGEGLIFHVRDQTWKKVAVKNTKSPTVEYKEELVDEGAKDKRAYVVEPEFSRVLRVMARDGNTLSSVIRQAWDSDELKVMTKNPLRATNAHISIIGHITKDELLRNLEETEMANGFANRFLWAFTRRSKYLPEGGSSQESDLDELVCRLAEAAAFARNTKLLVRDDEARRHWDSIYQPLSDGITGLAGQITSRAEPQVMRLACIYALLDCSDVIRIEHLEAGLGFWKYCEDSARYIFGDCTGNKTADAIVVALSSAERGLSKTDLRDLFQRNASAAQINAALQLLMELGRVDVTKEPTDGRPREVFHARRYDRNDLNDQSRNLGAWQAPP
jgi:Primase C terminal 1 (PriCT-1)